jgi:Family of unknown function (DUF6445)
MKPYLPPPLRLLPYEKPEVGKNFWVLDDALPNAHAIRERCLAKTDWIIGAPRRPESWPGQRAIPALLPTEMQHVEDWVLQVTKAPRLWIESAQGGVRLNHNCVQLVGARDSSARPHTDSRSLCRYAGVLYLNPSAPADCGTSFFRQRMPNGQLGGNLVTAPHNNLVEALGTRFVPANSFVEDVRVPNRFNRLLVYSAALIHSATAYCGLELIDQRMATVFFWMA